MFIESIGRDEKNRGYWFNHHLHNEFYEST